MKKFSTFLAEAAADFGGYKYPTDLGSGWETKTTENDRYVKRFGKGPYKGLVAMEFSEKWVKSNISAASLGSTWFPNIYIGYETRPGSVLFIGDITSPPIVNGKIKGNWKIKGVGPNDYSVPMSTIHHLKNIGEEKRMTDAIKKIVNSAAHILEKNIAPKGEYSLYEIENKIEVFLKNAKRIPERELFGKKISSFEVRHWGNWVVPAGVEDDGDYDWEVLDKASQDKVSNFVKDLQKHTSAYKVTWGTSEKNWLDISIEKK